MANAAATPNLPDFENQNSKLINLIELPAKERELYQSSHTCEGQCGREPRDFRESSSNASGAGQNLDNFALACYNSVSPTPACIVHLLNGLLACKVNFWLVLSYISRIQMYGQNASFKNFWPY